METRGSFKAGSGSRARIRSRARQRRGASEELGSPPRRQFVHRARSFPAMALPSSNVIQGFGDKRLRFMSRSLSWARTKFKLD